MRAPICVLSYACSEQRALIVLLTCCLPRSSQSNALELEAPARAAATAAPHRGAAHVVCTLPRCLCHHHHRPQTPRPLQGAEEGTRQTLATRPPRTKGLHSTTPAAARAARRAKATPHPAALTASPLRAHAAQRVTPRHARPPPAPASGPSADAVPPTPHRFLSPDDADHWHRVEKSRTECTAEETLLP